MATGSTLVTGAAGFAAGHLLDRLADDTPVVGWCRPDGHQPDPARHLDWHAVDLLDLDAVCAAFDELAPSEVYHLAGAPHVDSSWRSMVPHLQANALGTHHLLHAVQQSGLACRVLIVTSAQIYELGDDPINEDAPLVPPSPYGLSKLAQDELARRAAAEDGLDLVIARPFNHIGPRQSPAFAVPSFARQIARIEAGLEPPCIRVGNLDARRDISDVRDVVGAYHQLMASGTAGRAYNICSGRAWRIGDLLEELISLATVPVSVEVDEARFRPNDVPVVQGDASRIRSELGWKTTIPVEQTLQDTLEWWRSEVRAGQ
jgi:GDP-4-dehydro-6-deoxy-D-mannose reductase